MKDPLFIGAIILLLFLGNTILFSVQPALFPLQFLFLGVGVLVFILTARLDSIVLGALAPLFYGITLLLLLATLIVGIVSHGAIRWLPLGPFTLQPSEFAKPAVALMTAWILSKNLPYNFLISLFLAFLISLLIFIQPDFGTAAILAVAWLGSVLSSQISIKNILYFLISSFLILPIIWFLLAPYQKERITSFLNPTLDPAGGSYQARQAMITAGGGGVFGRGLGQGSQTQLAFLPARPTDFVFASIGEELGFIGMGLVVVSFFVLFGRILKTWGEARDLFSRAAISGIFFYLVIQTFINIGMNLGMLPIAGVPLPLVSAGGSALVATMLALGMIVALRK